MISGQTKKDHATLRSLSALIASLPASENKAFREEFNTVRRILAPWFRAVLIVSAGI